MENGLITEAVKMWKMASELAFSKERCDSERCECPQQGRYFPHQNLFEHESSRKLIKLVLFVGLDSHAAHYQNLNTSVQLTCCYYTFQALYNHRQSEPYTHATVTENLSQ